METNEKLIVKKILNFRKKTDQINIIAVDGITCSGKSLYAEILKKKLRFFFNDIFILSKDLFLISRKKRIQVTSKLNKKFSSAQNNLHYDKKKLESLLNVIKNNKIKKTIKLKKLYNRKNGKNDKNLTFNFSKKTVIIFEGLFILEDLKMIEPVYKILITNTVYNSLSRKIERIRDKKISIQKVVTEFTNLHLKSIHRYLLNYNFHESYSGEKNKFVKQRNGRPTQIKLINNFFKKHLF